FLVHSYAVYFFFFSCDDDLLHLHSFPTRRSSDLFGNGPWISRARLRDSDRWFVIARWTPGRSNQPQTYNPCFTNFQRDHLGVAGACFVATSRHPTDVDLAFVQSGTECGRECV